jgi:hypothetical protein
MCPAELFQEDFAAGNEVCATFQANAARFSVA